jgi:hypothetical protein
MAQPQIKVHWAGSTAPGQDTNPFNITLPPFVAAQLMGIAEMPEFREAALAFPRAYAGVMEFLGKISAEIARDGSRQPMDPAHEGHMHVRPAMPTAIRDGIDRVPWADRNVHAGRPVTPPASPPADPTRIDQMLLNSERSYAEPVRFAPGRVRIPGAGRPRHYRPAEGIGELLDGRGTVND